MAQNLRSVQVQPSLQVMQVVANGVTLVRRPSPDHESNFDYRGPLLFDLLFGLYVYLGALIASIPALTS